MDAAALAAHLPAALPRLRSVARRMVGHPQESEDVVQEAMLRATRAIGEFRAEASLETWLHAIVARTAIDHLRTKRRFRTQVMVDACNEGAQAGMARAFDDPSIAFDVHEHIAFCFGCVGRTLAPEESVALVLREALGFSNDEAARACGVSESILRHRLSEARTSMEREYEGLCALVNKDGPCHQCRTLRDLAPTDRRGPPLPPVLTFDDRARMTRESKNEATPYASLRDYFARVATERNDA